MNKRKKRNLIRKIIDFLLVIDIGILIPTGFLTTFFYCIGIIIYDKIMHIIHVMFVFSVILVVMVYVLNIKIENLIEKGDNITNKKIIKDPACALFTTNVFKYDKKTTLEKRFERYDNNKFILNPIEFKLYELQDGSKIKNILSNCTKCPSDNSSCGEVIQVILNSMNPKLGNRKISIRLCPYGVKCIDDCFLSK